MREFKFRAWDNDEDEMITGFGLTPDDLFPYQLPGDDCLSFEDPANYRYYDNAVLMQYTGLKDSKGNEIFEGDILRDYWVPIGKVLPNIRYFKVVFDNGSFTQWEPGDGEEAFDIWRDWAELEVVGNAYENPELLK